MTTSGFSRRKLLFAAGALGVTLLLPRRRAARAAPGERPRYLLHIMASGGVDTTMMFDARPLAMTAANKVHNPLGQEPIVFGPGSLTTTLAAPLVQIRDRFSVINGVLMSPSFDGHDQNTNVFLAGNPFGGVSFNSELNGNASAPLDYIRIGQVFATLEDSRTIELTPPGMRQLVTGVSSLNKIAPPLDEFLRSESAALGDPNDRFGAGVIGLDTANTASKELQQRIQSIQLGEEPTQLDSQLAMIREVFKLGIARGAMFSIDDLQFDNHAPAQARAQAPTYAELSRRLARIIQYLVDTPFDGESSLYDVTTIVIGSEFGRTMRQPFAPIDNTGTDHNPLSNTVLIGGSGIKGGLVVGASDFQTAAEPLSGAHLALDPDGLKAMGRPFDFTTGQLRTDRPASFAASDYLQIASVINTVYSLFDVPTDKWRLVDRGGEAAPVLSTLLA